MGKDLKDLEKELKKGVKKSAELGEDLAKDWKKNAKRMEETLGLDNKMSKKYIKKNKNFDALMWWLIVILFLTGWGPVALILLLIQIFGGKRGGTNASSAQAGSAAGAGRPKTSTRKKSRKTAGDDAASKWLKAGGIFLALVALLGSWDYLMWFLGGDTFWWDEVVSMLGGIIGGGAMFLTGYLRSARFKRYARYLLVMDDRDSVELEEFCSTLGLSRRKVERDLEKMIDLGYFGGKAYIHHGLGRLLRGEGRVVVEKKPEPQKPVEEVETEYVAILRKIRRANDLIEDEVLSEKIDRIETVTAGIFRVVEQEPEKKARIQTFLNYYLPTTQKLLDSYAEFEHAGVEGENLRQAKQRIEVTMDKIIEGFEHQLDELYRAEAMDVDSDIRVMETMLRRDTASVERDFGAAVQTQSEEE